MLFRSYISARSNVNEGAVLRFKGTWMRLTRRAVRDYNFRGTDVEDTLEMWANVRRGEKLYISPYKNRADIIFDSSLPYEVSVMKHYALPLLRAVPEENVRRAELLELIATLNADSNVNGILVQLPLPKHIDEKTVINAIVPHKRSEHTSELQSR